MWAWQVAKFEGEITTLNFVFYVTFFYDTSDDKLINIFIPIYFLFIHFWYILHPNIDVMNLYHRWLKFGWKKQFVSENTCNFYNVKFLLQGMTTDTKFTFSVGDTTHAVYTKGHFAPETESLWPLHFKHSHWWKRQRGVQVGFPCA